MNAFAQPYFQDEEAARAKIESVIWPEGPVCGRCGEAGSFTRLTLG